MVYIKYTGEYVRKLFLDDTRNPPDSSWDVVRSYASFVDFIERNGVPDVISFDHDLADEHYTTVSWQCEPLVDVIDYSAFKEKTGYECAKWLIERGELPKEYYVHSLNPVGAQNIRFVMNAAYKRRDTEDPVNGLTWTNLGVKEGAD